MSKPTIHDLLDSFHVGLVNEIVDYCFDDKTLDQAGPIELDTEYIFVSREELANSIRRALLPAKE